MESLKKNTILTTLNIKCKFFLFIFNYYIGIKIGHESIVKLLELMKENKSITKLNISSKIYNFFSNIKEIFITR